MRGLAILYIHFKEIGPKVQRYFNSIDMFHKENIPILQRAMVAYTEDGEDIKAGLKKDNKALVISSFLSVMKVLNNQMFGSAYYKVNITRLRTSRKPKEQDLRVIQDYSTKCFTEITEKVFGIQVTSEFVNLRNTVCACLTLFNGRRGGEPARMLLSDFEEAKKKEWFGPNDLKTLMTFLPS